MSTVIYHNPDCGTSRNVLAILKAAGAEPVVIDYRKEGWTRSQLLGLFAAAGLTPREALRTRGTPAEELGLTAPDLSDEDLVAAMVAHPILVNRPIVCTPKGVRLCRPSEAVLDRLESSPPGPLVKEDGEVRRRRRIPTDLIPSASSTVAEQAIIAAGRQAVAR